ncbi:MAG: ATP-binding protein [Leptolyngbya sp. SIO1D8]|nr:ATP-binding protein [Leptolyngbya sp. SIO1D8]
MMLTASPPTWQQVNQQYLWIALDQIKQRLSEKAGQPIDLSKDPDEALIEAAELFADEWETTAALDELCNTFNLSTFERDILVLCAGMEMDSSFGPLCAMAQGDQQKPFPTLGLAMNLFSHSHWGALTPRSPLRRWRLVELGKGLGLMQRPLHLNEQILHYLAGIHNLDESLSGRIEPVWGTGALVLSHRQVVVQLAKTWAQAFGRDRLPIFQLTGATPVSQTEIAWQLCQAVDLNLHRLAGQDVPSSLKELNQFLQIWEREVILGRCALLLDCTETKLEQHGDAIRRLLEQIRSPIIISTRDRLHSPNRSLINVEISKPSHQEQQAQWEYHLGDFGADFAAVIPPLVTQFNLSRPEIEAVCTSILSRGDVDDLSPEELKQQLWQSCCTQARPQMEDLAQRITVKATWDDLVLPEAQFQTLRTVAAQVRQRVKVYEDWGFSGKNMRGLGISAMFAGPSGTGKTTAAEILAKSLNLDLYRIDLSAVVSKYIGETEKNLRRVFDAAEGGGAVLLFDEADALFGKRSDVKDSHDRHANIEVSYLLQRMEAYQGLAILTTNLKGSLDSAFMRRIRFVVQFTFPDSSQRLEIWRRIFPTATPTQDLSFERLARLQVAGGSIRNIAMNAAFLAADDDEPVQMKHLLIAARSEYAKLEKSLTDQEIRGWV